MPTTATKKKKGGKSGGKKCLATDITIVLDRSGSMSSCMKSTIEQFNEFLQGQKKIPGECSLTLVRFDHEIETVYQQPIAEAPALTELTYVPRGTTALLDAIGKSINDADSREQSGRMMVLVVITDGLENCSQEYTRSHITNLISERRKRGWDILFLGANQDAIAEGGTMGIMHNQAITTDMSPRGVRAAYSMIGSKLVEKRSAGSRGMVVNCCFTEEDREEYQKIVNSTIKGS